MPALEDTIAENRRAVDALIAAARTLSPAQWTTRRAPGKWSPGQITEHVAITYELGRKVLSGTAPFPKLPGPLRGLLRWWVVRPVLKTGKFPSGFKTSKPFMPSDVAPAPDAAFARLNEAAAKFTGDMTAHASAGHATLEHPVFGTLSLSDYVQFNSAHARHHMNQFPK